MRVLTSSVLVMEAIVLLLAIPVAVVAGGQPAAAGWLLAGLALACALLPGLVNRPYYVAVGWALQLAVLASGVLAPMMFILGAVFTALWWTAVRLGRKADTGNRAV